MPAPPLPKSNERSSSPSKRSSSPRRSSSKRSSSPRRKITSRSASGAASSSLSRTKSYDSPTRSISSKVRATESSEVRGNSKRASLTLGGTDSPTRSISSKVSASVSSEVRGNMHGNSKRASLTLGGTDHSRTSRRGSSSETDSKTADRKKVNRPGKVSPFLKNKHRELKQQITVLQGHIMFIQDLAIMNDSKKINLLFRLIDRDGGGTVDAAELATAMRQNDELSFSESIEKAINMVATFDSNGDGELDKTEFRNYVTAMVQELKVPLSDFVEFLVVQLLLAQDTPEDKLAGEMAREHINKEVKKREELFAVLSSDRMTEAFEMFDKDSVGEVSFQKVAKALYQSTQNENKAIQEPLQVLLMIDMNDTRTLIFEQFGCLILSVSKTTGKSVEITLEDVMNALDSQSAWDENVGSDLMVGNDSSVFADGSVIRDEKNEPLDMLTYGRLKKLFNLWDADGDGDISMSELADGLRKFQSASGINVDADALAQALISFDEDGDNQLDPREFAQAMILYAKQFGVELHTLIDFMCLTSSTATGGNINNSNHTSSSNSNKNKNAFPEDDPWGDALEPAFDVDFWE